MPSTSTRMRTGALVVTMLQGAALPGQTSPEGCWDTVLGPWSALPETQLGPSLGAPPPDTQADSVYYVIPPRVRLDRAPSRDGEGWHALTIPEDALQTLHSRRSWRVEGDTLVFHLTTGFAGVHARLARRGASWDGAARTSSDVAGLLRYERSIRLVPVRCSDPPPIPATADRVLPRTVELAEAAPVELGRPFPDGPGVEPRRSGAVTVLASVRGELAGADTLIVRVARNGLVSRIELRYPPSFDFADLIGRLDERFGSGERSERIPTILWRNRTSELFAIPSRDGSSWHRLLLSDPRQGWEEIPRMEVTGE